MLCALSGEPVSDAVVSPRSGAVFERKLIESYISSAGKDPINDEPLSSLDLISLAVPTAITPPKPHNFTSIPTMLAAFQNEWDALALETFALRKQLHDARQELSATLYKYEAAVRVAARATKEKDDAQLALRQLTEAFAVGDMDQSIASSNGQKTESTNSNVQPTSDTSNNGASKSNLDEPVPDGALDKSDVNMPSDDISQDLRVVPVDRLVHAQQLLFALHKKQKIASPIVKGSKVSIRVESSEDCDLPGLRTIAFDTESKKSLCCGSFGVKLLPDEIVSSESTAAAFLHENDTTAAMVLKTGQFKLLEQNVTKNIDMDDFKLLATHPSEALFIVITKKNQWQLVDATGLMYTSEELESISSVAIHVDGILLALGRDGAVDIYEITSTKRVSTINIDKGIVTNVQFALNGFWIVITSVNENEEGSVDIYDLRKTSLVHATSFQSPVRALLDPSSLILTTYDTKEKKLHVNAYFKKGKVWESNLAELQIEELQLFEIESAPKDIETEKVLRLTGYSEKKIYHFVIDIDQH